MSTIYSDFEQLSENNKYEVVSLTTHLLQFQQDFNIPLFEISNVVNDIKYYRKQMRPDYDFRIITRAISLLYDDKVNMYRMVCDATKRINLYSSHEQEFFFTHLPTTLKFFQIIVLINTIKQCLSNVPMDAISTAFLNKLHDIKPSLNGGFKSWLNLPPTSIISQGKAEYTNFVTNTYGWDNSNINSLVREFSNDKICAIHKEFVELERSYST